MYVVARVKDRYLKKSLLAYITDALKSISENGTHFIVPGYGVIDYGSVIQKRWIDTIDPPPPVPEDNRPCIEIAKDIIARAKRKGGER